MNMSFGVFVCLICDNNPWIGLVEEINIENKDFQVRFMHPCYPSRSYYRTSRVKLHHFEIILSYRSFDVVVF